MIILKNTKKLARVAALLTVLCMISMVMIGGTFAKYTSEYSGQDTALVARWSFTAKGGDLNTTMGTDTDLALFDHLHATHINQTDGSGNYIIAPGVSDEFTVKMDYIADVDADVLIKITPLAANNATPPIEYSVDGGSTWVTLDNLSEALAVKIAADSASFVGTSGSSITDPSAGDKTFRIAKVLNNSTDDVNIVETVKWRWPYEAKSDVVAGSTNTTDTDLGVASQSAVTAGTIASRTHYGIKIDLTASQVVPIPPATAITAIGNITKVGANLTAGALTPGGATVTYQWQSSADGAVAYADIVGATSSTYGSPVTGTWYKVVATGTGSYAGSSQTSAAFQAP